MCGPAPTRPVLGLLFPPHVSPPRLRRILPDYAGTTQGEKAEGSCSTTDCSTGVLFLHETVTLIMLGGAVIILGGVLLTSFPRSRPA